MSAVEQFSNDKKQILINNFLINDLNLYSSSPSFYKSYGKNVVERTRVVKCATANDIKNEFYRELLIIIRYMQFLGALTISQDKNGRITAKFLSFPLFYFVIVYSVLTYFAYLVFLERLRWLTAKDMSFDDNVLHFNASVFMSSHFLPFIAFFERGKIANYVDSWNGFHMKYYKITGNFLRFKLKLKQIIFLIVTFVFIVLLCYALSASSRQDDSQTFSPRNPRFVYYLTTMLYYGCLMSGFSAFWYFFMSAVEQTASQLLTECKENKLNFINNIEEYRNLWIDLKNLCSRPGHVFSMTFLYFYAYMFCLLITSLYTLASSVGFTNYHISLHMRLAFAIVLFMATSVVGNCAHTTSAKVGEHFKRELFLYISTEKNKAIRKKLQWFVHNVSINPPIVSLDGYVNLNRSFNVSMYASLLTYLVVIMQFKMSGNDVRCS